MKKFSFRKSVAIIRSLKEPEEKKRKINYERIVYLIVVVVITYFLVNYVYHHLAIVEANGLVIMNKVDVNFIKDIRIKEINISEGDKIREGQPLFSYVSEDFDDEASVFLRNNNLNNKNKQDLDLLKKEIVFKNILRSNISKKLNFILQKRREIVKLILLDIYNVTELDDIDKENVKLNIEMNQLSEEIAFLKTQERNLSILINQHSYTMNQNYHNPFISIYRSPINGIIGQILKGKEESCYKGENVMTIHNPDEVLVKAYFNINNLNYIQKTLLVNIEFPNGNTSEGYIKRVYISTYEAPKEFQKTYEPTERNIVVEIEPKENKDVVNWKKFYKLNVKVSLKK